MQQDRIRIEAEGVTKEFPAGTCYEDIAKEFQYLKENDIVLVMVGNRIRELHKKAWEDEKITLITTADKIGYNTYRRSLSMLLMKALYHVGGHQAIEKSCIHFVVSGGYYCTIKGSLVVDQEFLDKVKDYMRRIVDEGIPIGKRSINTDDAIELFHKYGMYDKEKLFHYRRVSRVNIYSIADFEDYNYGAMVSNTSYLKYFDLKLFDDGLVLCLPRKDQPKKIAPFAPQKKIFQAQKEALNWVQQMEIPNIGAMNDYIVKQDVNNMILYQEALQEKKIAEIAQEIASDKRKRIVLIAGPSSSGKTTFSHRLSIQLATYGIKPHPIAVDNYFINRDQTPLDAEGKHDFECLEALDVQKFNEDINALLNGEEVKMPTYNFVKGQREYLGNTLQFGEKDVLVIEGIHCLNEKLTAFIPRENKFKIYISALTSLNVDEHNRIPTTEGRLLRRIVRDARTRGTSAQKTIAQWGSVRRGEEAHIFPFQEDADVMFNSALIYELAVMKIYAEPLLFGIEKNEPEFVEAKRLLKFLDYVVGISAENIPKNSILREFVGGSCFHV